MTKLYIIFIYSTSFLCHTSKRFHFHQTMDEGIAYPRLIMMWLDWNGNGPSFCNTFMLN